MRFKCGTSFRLGFLSFSKASIKALACFRLNDIFFINVSVATTIPSLYVPSYVCSIAYFMSKATTTLFFHVRSELQQEMQFRIILIITLIIYSIISFKNKQLDHKLKEQTNGDQHNPNQTTAK